MAKTFLCLGVSVSFRGHLWESSPCCQGFGRKSILDQAMIGLGFH
jgi:hypothetical protein